MNFFGTCVLSSFDLEDYECTKKKEVIRVTNVTILKDIRTIIIHTVEILSIYILSMKL